MYRTSLVDTNEGVRPPGQKQTVSAATTTIESKGKSTRPPAWNYLGDYKKSILIIVRYDNTPHLPDQQLDFLSSVLTACKLSVGDVAVINIANAPSAVYKDLQEKFKSRFTVLFGLTPQQLEMPLSFPEFQVQAFNNCTYLHAPALEALEADKVLKRKLWVCLRKMFGV